MINTKGEYSVVKLGPKEEWNKGDYCTLRIFKKLLRYLTLQGRITKLFRPYIYQNISLS